MSAVKVMQLSREDMRIGVHSSAHIRLHSWPRAHGDVVALCILNQIGYLMWLGPVDTHPSQVDNSRKAVKKQLQQTIPRRCLSRVPCVARFFPLNRRFEHDPSNI